MVCGKVLSYMPAFQPYRGKPAVRNDREGRGNVGIIRSPIRASTLPDCGGRAMKRASLPLQGRSSLLTVGADSYPARLFACSTPRPLRPARPDCAKHMDDSTERHYTEERQQRSPKLL